DTDAVTRQHIVTISLIVGPGSDFVVSAGPIGVLVVPGSSDTTTVTTAVSALFNSAVSFSVTGLPQGVTASFSPATIPAPGGGNSILTFTASSAATPGTANATVTASGGGSIHTATVSLTVRAGSTLVYTFPAATTVSSVRVVTKGAPAVDYRTAPGT